MTLSIAFSSQASLDDACMGLLPSSEVLAPEDFVTWEEPRVQLSEFDFNSPLEVESKGGLTTFKESIFRRLSNRSLHIWSLNHSLWEWSVALINFISWGSSIPSLLPKATCPKCKIIGVILLHIWQIIDGCCISSIPGTEKILEFTRSASYTKSFWHYYRIFLTCSHI